MFGVSMTELAVIFIIALLLFGPEQLPPLARNFGKIMGDLKRGSDSLRREFYNSVYKPADDLTKEARELGRNLKPSKITENIKKEILPELPKNDQ